jgi:hypothetical protein
VQHPERVAVGDQLGSYHDQREDSAVPECEHHLLDVGGARRQVHDQAVGILPDRAGDQAVHQQLRDRRLDAEPLRRAHQERGRRHLDPVPPHRLQPRPGGTLAREHGDAGGVPGALQAHHVRGVRAVQVCVDKPHPGAQGAERQRDVHRRRRLAHAALAAGDRDDRHLRCLSGHLCSSRPVSGRPAGRPGRQPPGMRAPMPSPPYAADRKHPGGRGQVSLAASWQAVRCSR